MRVQAPCEPPMNRLCPTCTTPLSPTAKVYCSFPCSSEAVVQKSIRKIQSGGHVHAQTLRRIVLRLKEYMCEICGITEWTNKPVPLVVDHKDGNPINDRLDNLRLICHNCDALLSTFGAKNRGNGRASRRTFYERNGYS